MYSTLAILTILYFRTNVPMAKLYIISYHTDNSDYSDLFNEEDDYYIGNIDYSDLFSEEDDYNTDNSHFSDLFKEEDDDYTEKIDYSNFFNEEDDYNTDNSHFSDLFNEEDDDYTEKIDYSNFFNEEDDYNTNSHFADLFKEEDDDYTEKIDYSNFFNDEDDYHTNNIDYSDLFNEEDDSSAAREVKLKTEQFVDMHLFSCLNNTHMMDYKGSVFSMGYRFALMALYRCFHVLYMRIVDAATDTGRESDDWDDLFITDLKTKSTKSMLTYERSESYNGMDHPSVNTACQLDYGSINRMPSISMCLIQDNNTDNSRLHEGAIAHCNATSHDAILLSSSLSCSHIQHATTMRHLKAAWLLAKFNYGLIVITTLSVVLSTIRSPLVRQRMRNSYLSIPFCCSQCTVDDMETPGNHTVGHQMAIWRSLHLCLH